MIHADEDDVVERDHPWTTGAHPPGWISIIFKA
jgi:hypothetical protein